MHPVQFSHLITQPEENPEVQSWQWPWRSLTMKTLQRSIRLSKSMQTLRLLCQKTSIYHSRPRTERFADQGSRDASAQHQFHTKGLTVRRTSLNIPFWRLEPTPEHGAWRSWPQRRPIANLLHPTAMPFARRRSSRSKLNNAPKNYTIMKTDESRLGALTHPTSIKCFSSVPDRRN